MNIAADGQLAARRCSGRTAGCSKLDLSEATQRAVIWQAKPHRRQRKKARQLTKMLSAALVPSNVRIVTRDSVRVKRILAEVTVRASVDQVWKVLTDYNKLADFVPNLDSCERMGGAPPGKQRLRQQACSQSLYWRLQAQAVVDVQEVRRPMGRRELHFELVEGDFQEFSGRWILDPDPSVQDGLSLATVLRYEVSIVPKWTLPSTLVTTIVRCGLPANVRAIADRAEQIAERRRTAPRFAKAAFADQATPSTWVQPPKVPQLANPGDEILPAKGPVRATAAPLLSAANLDAKGRILKNRQAKEYLGLLSVPVPFPAAPQRQQPWERVLPASTATEPETLSADEQLSEPSLDVTSAEESRVSQNDGSLEVHLRRLDDPLALHRRVVASVSIEASREEVWQILTDYEKLPEVIPNLVVSERLETPPGAPRRLVRLRQVGFKSMMYMHLHAEATLALVESPPSEIQFRQTNGDFQVLQGKFILQDASLPEARAWRHRAETVLKYAVEVEIPRTTTMLGLLEPLLESVVYHDIPANLEAIKHKAEALHMPAERHTSPGTEVGQSQHANGRPSAAAMSSDFSLLQAQLVSEFGEGGPLPSRRTMRSLKRNDLAEAINAHGGPLEVSGRLGWETDYRPRVAQMSLDEVQHAFDEFAAAEGLPGGTLPNSQSLLNSGRRDLVREAKKWGGLEGLAELFEYEIAEAPEEPAPTPDKAAVSEEQLGSMLNGRRPKRAQMVGNFDVLAQELKRCFGEGPLPSTTGIRSMGRNDLSVAITHHGGPLEVTRRLGWPQTTRPNYWADLDNCRSALNAFCDEEGLPRGTLPSLYAMQRAGRYDLQRAVRHWGGAAKLADALGFQLSDHAERAALHRQEEAAPLERRPSQREKQQKADKSQKSLSRDVRREIDSW